MSSTSRIGEIDLLRFLSALAVMIFHYAFRGHAADGLSPLSYPVLAPLAKYGYLGVHLFFIISGFVIMMSAADGNVTRFLISRVTRLYPAFWVCCTITFVVVWLFGDAHQRLAPSAYLINMSMLGGFLRVPLVDGVYWSLLVELKFYAWVLLILVARQIRRIEMFLGLWLVAILVLRIVPSWTLQSMFVADFAPLFVAGAMFSRIRSDGTSAYRTCIVVICWLLATFDAIAETPEVTAQFDQPFSAASIGMIVSAFFASMAVITAGRTGWLGRTDWSAWGALTYPLYLLHQNIGYVVFSQLYRFFDANLLLWGTMLLMLACAHVVHVSVERRWAPVLKRSLTVRLGASAD